MSKPSFSKAVLSASIFILGGGIHLSYAAGTRYGPEFTFTNSKLKKDCSREAEDGDENPRHMVDCVSAVEKLEEINLKLVALCNDEKPKCSVTKRAGGNRYYSSIPSYTITWQNAAGVVPSIYKAHVDVDPQVLEVTADPITIAEAQDSETKSRFNLIFKAAKEIGLEPDSALGIGGGHTHVDYNTFKDNPGDALRFLTLLHNFPYFFAGAWRPCIPHAIKKANPANWPTKTSEELPQLAYILGGHSFKHDDQLWTEDTFDSASYKSSKPQTKKQWSTCDPKDPHYAACVRDCFKTFSEILYFSDDRYDEDDPLGYDTFGKYVAFNLTRVADDQRPDPERSIEIRSIGPQRDFDHWIGQLRVLDSMVEYAKSSKEIKLDFKKLKVFQEYKFRDCSHLTLKAQAEAVELTNFLGLAPELMLSSWSGTESEKSYLSTKLLGKPRVALPTLRQKAALPCSSTLDLDSLGKTRKTALATLEIIKPLQDPKTLLKSGKSVAEAEALLSKNSTGSGFYLLQKAIKIGDLELATLSLANGADANSTGPTGKTSLLKEAYLKKNKEIFTLLLRSKAKMFGFSNGPQQAAFQSWFSKTFPGNPSVEHLRLKLNGGAQGPASNGTQD